MPAALRLNPLLFSSVEIALNSAYLICKHGGTLVFGLR